MERMRRDGKKECKKRMNDVVNSTQKEIGYPKKYVFQTGACRQDPECLILEIGTHDDWTLF